MSETSATLLERVRDPADREAWERFFGLYAPLLERYARGHGLSAADAEELRDQCLEVVARRMPEFRYEPARGGFQGWLHRIARDKLVDHMRRPLAGDGATATLGAIEDQGPTPDEVWERHWRSEHLRWALAQVRQRETERAYRVFEMLALDELPVEDVCERTGLNANQVYKAKSRVLARVREVLARVGVDADRVD